MYEFYLDSDLQFEKKICSFLFFNLYSSTILLGLFFLKYTFIQVTFLLHIHQ